MAIVLTDRETRAFADDFVGAAARLDLTPQPDGRVQVMINYQLPSQQP